MADTMAMAGSMNAEMIPNCYGGKTCDQIVPRWHCYADGDKEAENTHTALKLDPRTFPPGTKVIVQEPTCPDCGERRPIKFPTPKRGPMFETKCDCGFDWDQWTRDTYG